MKPSDWDEYNTLQELDGDKMKEKTLHNSDVSGARKQAEAVGLS